MSICDIGIYDMHICDMEKHLSGHTDAVLPSIVLDECGGWVTHLSMRAMTRRCR
eukprot:m.1115922 g.1115922  ORF g.1115922 m.1115922 type:complete len:54 (+) comp24373_c0_seq2:395-556(+)